MNVTILENKNFLENTEVVNKYKFLYIEAEFSNEIIEMLYYKIGFSWTYVDDKFNKTENFYAKTFKDFKNQFIIHGFNDEISAKKFLKERSKDNSNNKIFEFNKYQVFWFASFKKQKKKFGYTR